MPPKKKKKRFQFEKYPLFFSLEVMRFELRAFFLLRWGLANFFSQAGLEP
jgi:hypothetical protein